MKDNIDTICNFIKSNFKDSNSQAIYLSNYKKLLNFLKNNNFDIDEDDAKIILSSSPLLKKTFDRVYDNINEYVILNVKSLELLINAYNKIVDNYLLNDNGISSTLGMYFNDIKEYSVLTKEEEIDLISKIKKGDMNARNIFLNSNQGLVIGIARHFMISGLPLEDLIQEGNIGLMIALNKFDPSLGYKFSTYASTWIKEMMRLATFSSSKITCLSIRANRLCFKVKREINNYFQTNGVMPSNEEISKLTGISIEMIDLINKMDNISSLDEKINFDDNNSKTLGDTISYDDKDSIDDKIFYDMFMNDFNKLDIDSRTKRILELRYGLNGEEEHTFSDIGRMYGISRERVRQINETELRQLKLLLGKYGSCE